MCVCDKPWSGPDCSTMNFKPVTFPQGYGTKAANVTSWGGNTIYDDATKKHHMFVSRMTNDCLLWSWGSNSRIDHAVSDTITGPYKFVDVAIPTWSHNAAPIKLKDGTYAIIHIGTGTGAVNGGKNCAYPCSNGLPCGADQHTEPKGVLPAATSESSFQTFDQWRATAAGKVVGSTIHVSKTLDGPWTPLNNGLGECNNPAPWVHANGTIYCVCGNVLKRTYDLSHNWTDVTTFGPSGGPAGTYEDPFLYTTKRGYHLIYHVYNTHENPPHGHECFNSTVSAHAFSEDAFTWFMSPTSPYGTQVAMTSGGAATVATRERPKVYFNEKWEMTHLINGVCSASSCPSGPTTGCVDCKYNSWDYTLIQPLATQ